MVNGQNGAVLRCGPDGTIKEVVAEGVGIARTDAIGKQLSALVCVADESAACTFVSTTQENGAAFSWNMAVEVSGSPVSLSFDGIATDNGLMIVVKRLDTPGWRKEIEALTALNNRLINRQRILVRTLMKVSGSTGHSAETSPQQHFSPAEQEVLPLLLDGASNRSIAVRLGIAESAVKARLRAIYRKLQVGTRAQAVKALL